MQVNFEVGDEVSFENPYGETVHGVVQRVCTGSQIEVKFSTYPNNLYVDKFNPDLKLVKLAKQKKDTVPNIRDIPHAEIQLKWLSDDTLSIQSSNDGVHWKDINQASWVQSLIYRLVKKSPTVSKYHVAYVNPGNGSWTVTYNAGYLSVDDFYKQNESLQFTKAELIQASAVQSEESLEVVFVSPAK